MNTNLITDKIVIYFVATIAIVGVLVGTYFLISLVNLQNQHVIEEEAAQQSVLAIDNITKLIVKNQGIILASQDEIRNITKNQDLTQIVINETRRDNAAFFQILDGMIQAELEETKKIDKILDILNSSTKTSQ
jgi:hypothetical protein